MSSGGPVRWNHNIHYHRRILAAVPSGARRALDVGTGNGLLAADLHRRLPEVTGIDPDAAVLETARQEDAGVTWVEGDVMTYPFAPGSFDVVASVATLHHLSDLDRSFSRLAELTAPGGVVAVVGLAGSTRPVDVLDDLAGIVPHRWYRRRHGLWEHSAPVVWPAAPRRPDSDIMEDLPGETRGERPRSSPAGAGGGPRAVRTRGGGPRAVRTRGGGRPGCGRGGR